MTDCGSGGLVTPIFFVGATAGSIFAVWTGLDPSMFAAIGMVSLLAGASNTPISANIMTMVFFGPKIAPYKKYNRHYQIKIKRCS